MPFALLAIFIGIATGDIALYYLGRYSRYFRAMRYRLLTNPYFRQVRRRLLARPFINLFTIRLFRASHGRLYVKWLCRFAAAAIYGCGIDGNRFVDGGRVFRHLSIRQSGLVSGQ